ncbi:hypothetical protein FAES_1809 [Fibrella aestuarina BUZ 2]|uniref:Uncharacterized protein n=1 Tax=Fibrella aestuarina BUZ 2 TaxID=1166018 RepID=I0K6R6_9BACT|nr:hypothetical protein [Fibrella aestuarina]CCG99819.1 hypothetical protein FAES_1809 [Fibrella aestuarina BUZ 2]
MSRQIPTPHQRSRRQRQRVRLPIGKSKGFYEGVLVEIVAEIPFRGRAKLRLDDGRILMCKVANLLPIDNQVTL